MLGCGTLFFLLEPYMSTFADFGLPPSLLSTIRELGYETPTPVQAQAIPRVLEGKDVLATAQTGTGKTAAFALPLISRMLAGDRRLALIVAPTRELAEQIGNVLVQLTANTPHLRAAVIIGGSSYHRQIRSLRSRPAFVVGTPGRLLDQMQLKHLNLAEFGTLVIDEADRLLDMGFEPQMNKLVAQMPKERQSLLFSATLPEEIIRLANSYLREPVRIAIGSVSKPVDKITQKVVPTTAAKKDETLIREIDKIAGSLIVFTKTKWRTEKVAKLLSTAGHEVVRIHGDRTQSQRSNAIADFRSGEARILVATDIAARGIDIPDIRYVVNYDLPMCPEDYVHRIGRTARAGADGHALAFVTPEEERLWGRIHKLIYGRFPDSQPSNKKQGGGGFPPKRFNSRGPQKSRKREHAAESDPNPHRYTQKYLKGPKPKGPGKRFDDRFADERSERSERPENKRRNKGPSSKSKPFAHGGRNANGPSRRGNQAQPHAGGTRGHHPPRRNNRPR